MFNPKAQLFLIVQVHKPIFFWTERLMAVVFHCFSISLALLLLVSSFVHALEPGRKDDPDYKMVLTRLKATMEANRSAAKSVVLTGRIIVRGQIVARGTRAPEMEPYEDAGTFKFMADGFGRFKRWDCWNSGPKSKCPNEHEAQNENLALDVSIPREGYVRPVSQFMVGGNIDFYRDHWFGNEPIEDLLKPGIPGKWSVTTQKEGNLTLEHKLVVEGISLIFTVEIDPKKGNLARRVEAAGNISGSQCTWARDPKTAIWFQKKLIRRNRMIFPSKLVWEETIQFNVDEAAFNLPIDRGLFTFEGLGLEPGSVVWDQRFSPAVQYVYKPKEGLSPDLLSSLVPAEEVKAEEERRAWWDYWKYRLMLSGSALVLGALAAILYYLKIKKQRGVKTG